MIQGEDNPEVNINFNASPLEASFVCMKRGGTGAGWLTCCEEWQLVPVPTNRPHLCLTCQCPDSVSANQPLNWTQLVLSPNPPSTHHILQMPISLPPAPTPHTSSHSTSHSASVSSSCGAGGRHFSVFINVPRPINTVAFRPQPIICCLPQSRLSAAAPRHPSHHLHRDQNALIQFMQSLLFLNSHFVCSDEGPYCPLGWPSHVKDGGRVGHFGSRSWPTWGGGRGEWRSMIFSFVIYFLHFLFSSHYYMLDSDVLNMSSRPGKRYLTSHQRKHLNLLCIHIHLLYI